jgi:peptide deformylase
MSNPTELAKTFLAGLEACPDLLHAGDPFLRNPKVTGIGAQDHAEDIFRRLREALLAYRAATGIGRGLAAPQIGIASSAFVTYLGNEWKLFLNPSVIEVGERRTLYRERCLSCGPVSCDVARPAEILASWGTADGKILTERLSGFEARIFLHELDHLNGILCVDLAEPGSINLSTEDPASETFRPLP